jgi:hypothetical protein
MSELKDKAFPVQHWQTHPDAQPLFVDGATGYAIPLEIAEAAVEAAKIAAAPQWMVNQEFRDRVALITKRQKAASSSLGTKALIVQTFTEDLPWMLDRLSVFADALEQSERERERFFKASECPICYGTPHASKLICICDGSNSAQIAIQGFQKELFRVEQERNTLAATLRPLAKCHHGFYDGGTCFDHIREAGQKLCNGCKAAKALATIPKEKE